MKAISTILFTLALSVASLVDVKKTNPTPYQEDFDYFWQTINDNYCYLDNKETDWPAVKKLYQREADSVQTQEQFVQLLQRALRELYDHHATVAATTAASPRTVPEGADIWAEYYTGRPIITDVRRNHNAARVGIKAGMEIIAVNDVPVEKAITNYLGKSLKKVNPEAINFALRTLLAGNSLHPRKITVSYRNKTTTFYPDIPTSLIANITGPEKIETIIINDIGYLKINNSLSDPDFIPAFDKSLDNLMQTTGLILDLRETPTDGNAAVVRALLGRFISEDHFYEGRESFAELKQTGIKRSWMEIVSPREQCYAKPLVVLVNHWTGSLGESITVALDGMKRATTLGTKLARLNGANKTFRLPHSQIRFSIPVEKLYHINGTPRSLYRPHIQIDYTKLSPRSGGDIMLEKAIGLLKGKNKDADITAQTY